MRLRITLILACALVLFALDMITPGGKQLSFSKTSGSLNPPRGYLGCTAPGDEILKAEYKKSVDDIRELSKLADDLKGKFENNGAYLVSLTQLKESEEIEKLAKRIHGLPELRR